MKEAEKKIKLDNPQDSTCLQAINIFIFLYNYEY